jgi:hypothetical protein
MELPMTLGPWNAIWDDDEWISWDFINEHIEDHERREMFPKANVQLVRIFEDLVTAAADYHAMTGRYLQIWGELGEFYAEMKYGIQRHKPHAPGSDGRMGDDFVEVKTISPEKGDGRVLVKRAGNFSKLAVVRISPDWQFESRLIDRKALGKGSGKHAKVNWHAHDDPANPIDVL